MENNCPSCGAILGSYDRFFCSACGKPFPEQMIKPPKEEIIKTVDIPENNSGVGELNSLTLKNTNSKIFIGIFVAILLLGALFLWLRPKDSAYYPPTSPTEVEVSVPEKNEVVAVVPKTKELFLETEYDMLKDYLSFEPFVLNVPGDTDVYIYGLRLDEFSDILLQTFEINLSDYISKISSTSFAFIIRNNVDSEDYSWAILMRNAVDVNALGNINSYEIGNTYIAFSPSQDYLKDIELTSNKIVRNLRQSASLILALGEYPDESRVGKLFVYTTDSGKELINGTCLLSEDLILNSFCNSDLNYAILR